MDLLTSAPHAFAFPVSESDPEIVQPCHEGFAGLTAEARATRAETLFRAHSIWDNNGRPDNTEVADWLAAETEVRNEISYRSGDTGAA